MVCLTGHCYLALGDHAQALYEYRHILDSFERPDDMPLLYLNCAKVMADSQEIRKVLLICCKNHPTPYTWLSCGKEYFKVCCSLAFVFFGKLKKCLF